MTTNTAAIGGAEIRSLGFLSTLTNLATAYRHARARRRTQMALADLEDHVLRDIGFNPRGLARHQSMADWVVQTQSGTARLVFIGR